MKSALIVVDVQNDFVEGGALAVKGGLAIVPVINKAIRELGVPVITSQDWHPLDHCSFDKQGGPWPVHCLARCKGADLVDGLELPKDAIRIFKGAASDIEAYSPFDGVTFALTSLNTVLKEFGAEHVYICGIALNFCVRATVLDAIKYGYKTTLLTNATVGIDGVDPEPDATLHELATKGCTFMKVGK